MAFTNTLLLHGVWHDISPNRNPNPNSNPNPNPNSNPNPNANPNPKPNLKLNLNPNPNPNVKLKPKLQNANLTLTLTLTLIQEHCPGGQGEVTCRITHVYPDGLAPYYTILATGDVEEERDRRIEQWVAIKAAATRVMIRHGTTATHHHAVGKLHRPHYEVERGALFEATLRAIKGAHDPQGILNPDVLIRTSKAKEAASSFLGGVELSRARL